MLRKARLQDNLCAVLSQAYDGNEEIMTEI
jgi:hypothetical protein